MTDTNVDREGLVEVVARNLFELAREADLPHWDDLLEDGRNIWRDEARRILALDESGAVRAKP